jgi:hypothetical protein
MTCGDLAPMLHLGEAQSSISAQRSITSCGSASHFLNGSLTS